MMDSPNHHIYTIFAPSSRAECISMFRKRLGMTQAELARFTGHTRVQISKMETEERRVPEDLWNFILKQAHKLFAEDDLSYDDFRIEVNTVLKENNKGVR